MTAILITSLMLSGCAASEKNKDKKADERFLRRSEANPNQRKKR